MAEATHPQTRSSLLRKPPVDSDPKRASQPQKPKGLSGTKRRQSSSGDSGDSGDELPAPAPKRRVKKQGLTLPSATSAPHLGRLEATNLSELKRGLLERGLKTDTRSNVATCAALLHLNWEAPFVCGLGGPGADISSTALTASAAAGMEKAELVERAEKRAGRKLRAVPKSKEDVEKLCTPLKKAPLKKATAVMNTTNLLALTASPGADKLQSVPRTALANALLARGVSVEKAATRADVATQLDEHWRDTVIISADKDYDIAASVAKDAGRLGGIRLTHCPSLSRLKKLLKTTNIAELWKAMAKKPPKTLGGEMKASGGSVKAHLKRASRLLEGVAGVELVILLRDTTEIQRLGRHPRQERADDDAEHHDDVTVYSSKGPVGLKELFTEMSNRFVGKAPGKVKTLYSKIDVGDYFHVQQRKVSPKALPAGPRAFGRFRTGTAAEIPDETAPSPPDPPVAQRATAHAAANGASPPVIAAAARGPALERQRRSLGSGDNRRNSTGESGCHQCGGPLHHMYWNERMVALGRGDEAGDMNYKCPSCDTAL
ncbi:hypothetical protein M885DRAFT_575658 [Pelagophyceae sp. CCMP2097]|nr:hypothetical protein M885DRAFT_575658 [Pelagophyceae sp. CCMP2097]